MSPLTTLRRPIAQPTYAAATVPAVPVVRTGPDPATLPTGDWSIQWTAVDLLLLPIAVYLAAGWSPGTHRRHRGAVRRRGITRCPGVTR